MAKTISIDELAVAIQSLSKTVDDLAAMTKEGFDQCATKEDLKRFATKEDLERFATKDYVDEKFDQQKNYTDEKFEQLMGKSDYQVKLLLEVRDELAASYGSRLRQQDEIDNNRLKIKKNTEEIEKHELRIKKLELASI